MPEHIKFAKQRAEVIKMMIWIVRTVANTYLETDLAATRADDVMLICAVFVSQIDKRPSTAAKLAAYIGMPRATAVRKLADMQARGLVNMEGGRASLPLERLNAQPLIEATAASARIIHRVSKNLSRMDALTVANGEK